MPSIGVGRRESRGFRILNMFDRGSRPTITESADFGIESADSTADSATNPLKIGRRVRALSLCQATVNHSRYGPFPLWASCYGPHGGRYGPHKKLFWSTWKSRYGPLIK